MDAPLYPPASAFVQPQRTPRALNTQDVAIADLKANPTAWAIVLKEIPNMEARIGNEMIKPHLGNFSLRSLVQFGVVPVPALDRIDVQLKALGEVK
ncbi:MAG TPA: hypothetical protein VF503_07550 [Sphingobium sp.]|uniref:hypothetical protein n=1 Tax=Sphingobium sp. TaxID=1912891 RepID=UPI002ED63517